MGILSRRMPAIAAFVCCYAAIAVFVAAVAEANTSPEPLHWWDLRDNAVNVRDDRCLDKGTGAGTGAADAA